MCIPNGGEKFGPFLQGKVVSAPLHPQAESAPPRQRKSSFFEEIGKILADLDDGKGYLGSFSVCFECDD